MPKVKHYSAAWLSGNAPGHGLFEPSPEAVRWRALSPSTSSRKKPAPGPRRTIARRGTEVFVAVGKEIRWADLVYVRDDWAAKQSRARPGPESRVKRDDSTQSVEGYGETEHAAAYRVGRGKPSRPGPRC